MEPLPGPDDLTGHDGEATPPSHGGCRVQSVTCGNCGWPCACVTQEGLRVLQFFCHWCSRMTVGVVDQTIKRTIIF